jgi:Na+-transporting NADH:ubiquinone oxidoreductase subunit A
LVFKLAKGLDLPIRGVPDQRIDEGKAISKVAVLGDDYIGLKPTMRVKVGDKVKQGDILFEDKKNPGVFVTSPAAGKVAEVNRGEKRKLLSVVIQKEGKARVKFKAFDASDLGSISEKNLRSNLQKSGVWNAFRTRPFNKVPAVDAQADAIFVNAMDTNPLAADPAVVIAQDSAEFKNGLKVLSSFGKDIYVSKAPNADVPTIEGVNVAEFAGPHPAGNASTHIHYLLPASLERFVWTINYQDVIAIGKLFTTGYLDNQRVIAFGGPKVSSPRLLKTELGASVDELIEGAVSNEGDHRAISGSILNGSHAAGAVAYLGRYDNQISVIDEDRERHLFGWIAPGANRFSKLNVFISSLFGRSKLFNLTSSQNGSPRAIVPIGVFEKVMPLDILPTPLLKAVLVKDTDQVQQLGGLELVEEDLALCTFVDPGKHDFGPVLRDNLTQIELEG